MWLLVLALVSVPVAQAATDEEQIDEIISQFWQAYQKGDFDTMAKYVAEDITVVSGIFAPPTVGWNNVRQAYVSQNQTLENIQVTRQNTRITVRGKCAWATHQWTFSAVADRKPFSTAGHTTFIFEKRGGRWLIVHNHSSVVVLPQAPATQTPQPAPSGK